MIEAAPKTPVRVDLNWRIKSPLVGIGPETRTVMQVQAVKRPVDVVSVRVDYPDFPEGGIADAYLVMQPRVVGMRTFGCLREGDSVCIGRGDFPWAIQSDDWLHCNCNEYPHDYWQHVGPVDKLLRRVRLERGECLGVVVRCNMRAGCKVSVGGLTL